MCVGVELYNARGMVRQPASVSIREMAATWSRETKGEDGGELCKNLLFCRGTGGRGRRDKYGTGDVGKRDH